MKKTFSRIAVCVNCILVLVILFLLTNINYSKDRSKIESKNDTYISYLEANETEEEIEVIEDKKEITNIESSPKVEVEKVPEKTNDNNSYQVLSTVYGKLTGYGYDCYGCTSGRTAAGYDITNGNIYYNDSTYGRVRILSGGPEYPFGTIVRITDYEYSSEPIIAVVLDRGGSVGANRRTLFDLCYETERVVPGTDSYVTFEILRIGY
jgi:hypothetical protein